MNTTAFIQKMNCKRKHPQEYEFWRNQPKPRAPPRAQESNKRFKLNDSTSFNNNEESIHFDLRNCNMNKPEANRNDKCYNEHGAQGTPSDAAEGEADEDGNKPFGVSKNTCLNNSPSSGNGKSLSENAFTAFSVSPPQVASMQPSEVLKELNIDGSQEKDCTSPEIEFDEKDSADDSNSLINCGKKKVVRPRYKKRLEKCEKYAKLHNGNLIFYMSREIT